MTRRNADHARCTAVITLACAAIIGSMAYVYAAPSAGRTQLNIEARTPAGSPIVPYTTMRSPESSVLDEANSFSTFTPDEADLVHRFRPVSLAQRVCAAI